MSDDTQFLTQEKYDELTKELEHLKTTKRKEIAEQLDYARSLGDLSENAEYHDAREMQSAIEGRIRQIENILSHARVVSSEDNDGVVRVGSKVVIQKIGDKEPRNYEVVGTAEANMQERKISHLSPLGKSLIGKKKNQCFEFETPNGVVKYKVVEVS
jgi:transcription elongation factor GreA